MSTPDKPETPQLTRRQLRELRNTASTPIITPEEAEAAATPAPVAPLPRAAEPLPTVEEPPVAEAVNLEEPALTRRAARQQVLLRTASVPVVEPVDEGAAGDDSTSDAVDGLGTDDDGDHESDAVAEVVVVEEDEVEPEAPLTEGAENDDDAPHPVVAPTFGSELLAGENVDLEMPASFDQLLTRSTATGSLAASNALILPQTPDAGSLVSSVTATGEVLITGTFNLPESFGSTGTSHGSSDGKEIDAILIDGELPPTSSPTPVAASSAISTIKSAEDIIKPPVPEKGSRLMLTLVITAGVLALALAGVLIVGLVTGVFR